MEPPHISIVYDNDDGNDNAINYKDNDDNYPACACGTTQ